MKLKIMMIIFLTCDICIASQAIRLGRPLQRTLPRVTQQTTYPLRTFADVVPSRAFSTSIATLPKEQIKPSETQELQSQRQSLSERFKNKPAFQRSMGQRFDWRRPSYELASERIKEVPTLKAIRDSAMKGNVDSLAEALFSAQKDIKAKIIQAEDLDSVAQMLENKIIKQLSAVSLPEIELGVPAGLGFGVSAFFGSNVPLYFIAGLGLLDAYLKYKTTGITICIGMLKANAKRIRESQIAASEISELD